jgi:hypothetical protein
MSAEGIPSPEKQLFYEQLLDALHFWFLDASQRAQPKVPDGYANCRPMLDGRAFPNSR